MFNGLSAQLKRATDEVARSADGYKAQWERAYSERLSDARRMHAEINRLERQSFTRRQAEQRAADRGYRSAGARGPSATSALIGGAITFSGVASAFRKRMEVNVAETKAQIFGGLSSTEVKKIRGDWSDKVAIQFGESASAVLESYTEALKAGFGSTAAKKITENALEAASALEMNTGELMKLAGKTATALYGDVRKADPVRVAKMMNSVAIAAAATAADPNEVVEANKRALAALSTTKMRDTDLSAFTSVGISAGLQANKAGTFLGYLTSEFANAGNARGQRAADLGQAARMIGYGSRSEMAKRMASAPTEFMLDMFGKMQGMTEQNRAKFANLAGMREWRDELVQMAKAVDQIRATLKEIEEKTDSASAISKIKMDSLRKRFDQMKAAFGIAWEKFGEGFEEIFIQVSDWFRANANSFTFDKIKEKSRELVEGLKTGFGITNIKDSLDNLLSRIKGADAMKAIEFVKGFAEGLGFVFDVTKSALTGLASIFGDGDSARGIGKFAAQLLGFAIVLRFFAPVVSVLGSLCAGVIRLVSGLRSIGNVFSGGVGSIVAGSFKTLGKGIVGGLIMTVGDMLIDVLVGAVDWALGKMGINPSSKIDTKRLADRGLWQKLNDLFLSNDEFRKKYERRSDPRDVGKAVGEELKKSSLMKESPFAGSIQPASFVSGSGGFSYARLGSGISLKGTPLHNAVPGQRLPSFGLGSNGIIRRDRIPSFGGTGGSMADGLSRSAFERKFAGTALEGKYDQVVSAAKANGISPALLAGVMAHETGNGLVLSGNNPGGIMDPATGMARKMKFADLDARISKTAQTVAKNYRRAGGDIDKMGGFYAPQGAANDRAGLNGGWPAGVRKNMNQLSDSSSGSAGTGDAVGWARKYLGMNEYTDTRVLASTLGGDVRGKSNAWCARFVNKALAEAGGRGTGSAVANSFQRYGSAVNPSDVMRNDVLLQTKGLGYNQPGGHVGLATGETRMVNGRLQLKMIAGNDNDSVREHWIDADKNLMVRRGNAPSQRITDQVPASSVIQNVPTPQSIRGDASLGLQRGGSGPVAIHINGNSHDPEALGAMAESG
ncbi:phage tail tape measure protein [Bradyrhizobium japonicum]|uniref:phage tail tape measure protein n=1 Tax=Bradyrhizobium japonicum TaxID=375 RepID=UPI0009B69391|nr:phage tail tape measure protein [Bradyrhizobium japonicum]